MKFTWFKKKQQVEAPEVTYNDLPVIVVDDDFFEYLEEESDSNTIEEAELGVLFAEWLADNEDR